MQWASDLRIVVSAAGTGLWHPLSTGQLTEQRADMTSDPATDVGKPVSAGKRHGEVLEQPGHEANGEPRKGESQRRARFRWAPWMAVALLVLNLFTIAWVWGTLVWGPPRKVITGSTFWPFW